MTVVPRRHAFILLLYYHRWTVENNWTTNNYSSCRKYGKLRVPRWCPIRYTYIELLWMYIVGINIEFSEKSETHCHCSTNCVSLKPTYAYYAGAGIAVDLTVFSPAGLSIGTWQYNKTRWPIVRRSKFVSRAQLFDLMQVSKIKLKVI